MNELFVPRSALPVRGTTMPVVLFDPGSETDSIVGPFTIPDDPAAIAVRMIQCGSWFIHPHELWTDTVSQTVELNAFRRRVAAKCQEQGIRLSETKLPGERMTLIFGQARDAEIVPTPEQIQRSITAVQRYRTTQQDIPTAAQVYQTTNPAPTEL